MQSLKIDLLKLTGSRAFTSKDGTAFIAIPIAANGVHVGEKGSYLDVTLMDNRDGPGKYGDDGFAVVNLPRERREAGEKGPIIGNWRHVRRAGTEAPKAEPAPATQDDRDEIPW